MWQQQPFANGMITANKWQVCKSQQPLIISKNYTFGTGSTHVCWVQACYTNERSEYYCLMSPLTTCRDYELKTALLRNCQHLHWKEEILTIHRDTLAITAVQKWPKINSLQNWGTAWMAQRPTCILEGPMGTGTLHLGARFNASNCDSFIKRQPSKCDKCHGITPIMYVLCHITQNFWVFSGESLTHS